MLGSIDLNARHPRDGRTPLMFVLDNGCFESAKLLLNTGNVLLGVTDNAGVLAIERLCNNNLTDNAEIRRLNLQHTSTPSDRESVAAYVEKLTEWQKNCTEANETRDNDVIRRETTHRMVWEPSSREWKMHRITCCKLLDEETIGNEKISGLTLSKSHILDM